MSRKRSTAITHPQSFYDRLGGVAQRLGTTPDALLGVMKIESGLNPSAVNRGTNATGLIQFMPKTAKSVGTSVESLKKMSATDQLAFVEKYYTSIGMRNRMNTVHDAYLATFYPKAVGKPDHYEFPKEVVKANRGIDLNKDGRINVGEVKQFVDQRLGIKANPYPALKMNDQAMVVGNNYAFTGRDNTSVVNNSPTIPGVFVATKGLRPEAVVELGMNPRLGGDAGWVMQNILAPKGKAKGMLPKAENGLIRLSDDERKGTRTTTLPETEIKSVSPRQQAYNDSLRLYNLGLTNEKNQAVIFSNAYKRAGAGRNLVAETLLEASDMYNNPNKYLVRPGGGVTPRKYNNIAQNNMSKYLQWEREIIKSYLDNPYTETDINGLTSAERTKIHSDALMTMTTQRQIESRTGIKPTHIILATERPFGLIYKKPVYNPAEHTLNKTQPKGFYIEPQQPKVSVPRFKQGWEQPDVNYPTLKIRFGSDGKPTHIVNSIGETLPYVGDQAPYSAVTKEFAYPKLNEKQ